MRMIRGRGMIFLLMFVFMLGVVSAIPQTFNVHGRETRFPEMSDVRCQMSGKCCPETGLPKGIALSSRLGGGYE